MGDSLIERGFLHRQSTVTSRQLRSGNPVLQGLGIRCVIATLEGTSSITVSFERAVNEALSQVDISSKTFRGHTLVPCACRSFKTISRWCRTLCPLLVVAHNLRTLWMRFEIKILGLDTEDSAMSLPDWARLSRSISD